MCTVEINIINQLCNNNNNKKKQSNFPHTLHEMICFIRSVDVNKTFLNVLSIITAPIAILSCPRLTITCLKRNRYRSFNSIQFEF